MKKYIVLIIILKLLLSNITYAAFEYNGTFTKNRHNNQIQSYYVLLNKEDKVTFSFKCNGKQSKEVFVKSIKLTSDDKIKKDSNNGLESFEVPISGIYEISVLTNSPVSNELVYELTVDKNQSSIKNEATDIVKEKVNSENILNEEKLDNSVKINEIAVNKEKENLKSENTEIKNTKNTNELTVKEKKELIEPKADIEKGVIKKILTSSNTDKKDVDNNFIPKKIDKEDKSKVIKIKSDKDDLLVKSIAIPLSVDTQPIKEDNQLAELKTPQNSDNKPSIIDFNGKLNLIKSFDAFKFIGDRNKCWPKSICYDNENNIWVLDAQLCRILCFDLEGNEITYFGSKGKARYELGIPSCFTVFNNYILVGDRQKKCIHIFDKKGNWLNSIQNDPRVGLKISNPVSINVRKDEIWIGDCGTKRILCFDKNFSFLGSFGSTNESKFNTFSDIATNNDFIYILEEEGNIKKFGTMGNYISETKINLTYSNDLFIDSDNHFWISNIDSEEVICVSEKGDELYTINKNSLSEVIKENQSFNPSSIVVNSKGQIAIADTYSKQIFIFEIK